MALAFPLGVPHLARTVSGVTDYARQHGHWTFITSPPTLTSAQESAMSVLSLKGWPGDGVIALITTEAEARAGRQLGMPVVNMTGVLHHTGLPRVMVDQQAIGRLAAEHLLDRGLRRLAYYGFRDVWYSQQRREGFVQRIEEAGGHCSVYEEPPTLTDMRQPWHRRVTGLGRWLQTLKPPVGLMAVHDYRARTVVDECDRLHLNVPNDVAVIGVDNDQTICEFCQPPLSSVSRSGYQLGYEVAVLLDRLMAGEEPPKQDILIPPDGVIARRSSDVVGVEDPHVTAAVRFIREHAGEQFGVERLLRLVPVSRRRLEKRFKQFLGRTPHEYICHVRVERAKQLLIGSKKMRLKDVAAACGFPDAQRFRHVFRRLTGSTPREYRRSRSSGA